MSSSAVLIEPSVERDEASAAPAPAYADPSDRMMQVKIVLMAEGPASNPIAPRLFPGSQRPHRWQKRFFDTGLAGLAAPRHAAEPVVRDLLRRSFFNSCMAFFIAVALLVGMLGALPPSMKPEPARPPWSDDTAITFDSTRIWYLHYRLVPNRAQVIVPTPPPSTLHGGAKLAKHAVLVASYHPRHSAGMSLVRSGDILACIRAHESGGDYSANTGNGYYGAYQFSPATWRSVGGSGLPSDASPAEQDRRALMLAQRSGWGQWPNTSRMCGA